MATSKKSSKGSAKKSNVQVRDMKPSKDTKGGATSKFSTQTTNKYFQK